MANNNGFELDWGSTIDQDEQQYTSIPEGDYDYVVDRVEKSFVGDGSEKYAGMKMAIVHLNVQVPDIGEVPVRENFILHSNFAWKIGALLVSTGLKKKGENIQGNYWNRLPGSRGRCRITQRSGGGNSDRKFNSVQTFYEPKDGKDSGGNKWAI